MELIFIITILIISSLVNILLKKRAIIECISAVSVFITVVLSTIIAIKVANFGFYNPFSFFYIDALGAIMILIVSFIGFFTAIYSIPYLRKETTKNIIGFTRVKQYFILLNLFLVAMFLAISASNPIFAWISIEATTLSTAFLVSFYNKPSSVEAAWKYLIINSVGLLLGFFGTLLYFTEIHGVGGAISWHLLLENASNLDPLLAKIAFIFVLIGYGTKVGFVPMHTWKPDAYSKAPAPLGALLSGALLPIAFMIILKFKKITDAVVGPLFSQHLLIAFGILSVSIAALIIFNSKNYKRLLAYSSIENAGIMALGFGFGGLAIFATIIHMIYHSCVKAILFFTSGNLLLKYSSDKIDNIKGALKVLPITSILFILGFLIVTGTPPFGIFFTKMYILSVGIKFYPFISFIVLFFLAITFIGFLKHISSMFLGEKPIDTEVGESSMWLLISPVIFLIIIIILSFYIPPFLLTLINKAVLLY